MKGFKFDGVYLAVGTAREVRSLYRKMVMRSVYVSEYQPVFVDAPILYEDRMYAVSLDTAEKQFAVIGEHTLVRYMMEM